MMFLAEPDNHSFKDVQLIDDPTPYLNEVLPLVTNHDSTVTACLLRSGNLEELKVNFLGFVNSYLLLCEFKKLNQHTGFLEDFDPGYSKSEIESLIWF